MDRIQQQVECPVCMEQFQTPKILPCQHTFCHKCLEDIHNSDGGQNIKCPECRQDHSIPAKGIAGFPTSVTVQRLIEAVNLPNEGQSRVQPSAPPASDIDTVIPAVTSKHNQVTYDELKKEKLERKFKTDYAQVDGLGSKQNNTFRTGPQVSQNAHVRLERNTNIDQAQVERRATTRTPNFIFRSDPQGNQNSSQRSGQNANTDQPLRASTYQRAIHAYRRYLRRLFKQTIIILGCMPLLLFITFARFVAGAVKLNSDCPDEYNVAVYSFVKSWFGFLFHVTIIVLSLKKIEKTLDNTFIQVWLFIHGLFSIIWLFIGTAWVFGKYAAMKTECPKYAEDWNFHFINFILFLTAVDWIGFVVLLFFSLYVLGSKNDVSAEEPAVYD